MTRLAGGPRVFMPAPGEAWAGDVATAEFRRGTRLTVVDSVAECDLIWMYSKWIAPRLGEGPLGLRPCITTVHHIVPSKGIDTGFLDRFTTAYHVPNPITARALRPLTARPIHMLPYWIDPAAFPTPAGALSLSPGGPIVVGSFQRDTEGHDLTSPKLEKGPDVLLDVLSRIAGAVGPRLRVILGGWRRQYVLRGLARLGIAHEMHERVPDVSRLYARCHYYLVASRHEGGPQAVLEAPMMRTRILSTRVGVAPDVLHPDCLCDDPGEMAARVVGAAIEHTVGPNLDSVMRLTLGRVVPLYDALAVQIAGHHARHDDHPLSGGASTSRGDVIS